MEFYEAVNKRRTIRDFAPEAVEPAALERILAAALKAPTNDHMRDWHYIVIDDRSVAARLLDAVPKTITDEQMDALIRDWNLNDPEQQGCYRDAVPKQHRMLLDAGAIVVPLLKQKTSIMQPQSLSDLNGFASIWLSIGQLFLAATAEGYACTLRIPKGGESEWAREVLGFPAEYFMPCFIGVGRPAKDAFIVKQKDIDPAERTHRNRW